MRDSGLVHTLLGIDDRDSLLGHPVAGAKRGLAPSLGRGFHNAREDLQPSRTFVVYAGQERYAKADDIEVVGVRELCNLIIATVR